MNHEEDEFTRSYIKAMREYVAKGDEASLHAAYELGRRSIANGLGVMDVAHAHERAMAKLFDSPSTTARARGLATAFFVESLWPFEMTQRGFQDSNRTLRDMNGMLETRARQLALANDDLEREIAERRRVEKALLESEENLRSLSARILMAQEEERKRISRE